jgi:asparagine synthase (glutamine-hydrolysing)
MCGIVGLVGIGPDTAHEVRTAERMLATLAHRGPDESQVVRLGSAVLGTARLALVDRPTSKQPMQDPSGRYMLSFNGEIYNYRELRRSLELDGMVFNTSGDTEVLLQWLVRWGVDRLADLKGQFALAFWDSSSDTIVLARDRFGIVPLYFARTPSGRIALASEVKAIQAGGFPAQLSVPDLIDTGVFWGLHPGRSTYAGVESVPPGCYVRSRSGTLDRGAYWRFQFPETRAGGTVQEQGIHLANLLSAAVERRVPAYGDPAVLVSGGLDSSAVLSLLRGARPDARIRSFSMRFAEKALDESRFQELATQVFSTDHHSVICDDDTVATTLVKTILHAEVPLVRTAPASSYQLAREIEAHHTRTVLSGEGADELLCGYDLFKVASIRDSWSKDPDSPVWPRMLEKALGGQRELGRTVERAFYEQGLDQRSDPIFSHQNRWRSSFRITQYLAPDIRAGLEVEQVLDGVRDRLPQEYHHWSAVEQAQYLEVSYFLSSALLGSQCDRPYMAHSIEARYPFLDEDVVDFALTLPQSAKLDGMNEKAVLKSAMGLTVPPQILDRVKQPYTAPEGNVFRSEPGKVLLDTYLSKQTLKEVGVFDVGRVEWLVRKLERSRTSFYDDLAILWVLSTQVLANTYGMADL